MRALTRRIGRVYTLPEADLSPADPLSVLISRPNHRLGNLLLITPLLQEISTTFPNARIDLFVKGSLPALLFGEHPNVNRVIQLPRKPFRHLKDYLKCWFRLRSHHYDLVVNVDRNSSSGTLSTRFSRSRYKIYGDQLQEMPDLRDEQKHIARGPVYALRNFLGAAGITTEAAVPNLCLPLRAEELAAGRAVVEGLVPQPERRTICLFSFATGEKCYDRKWWAEFYGLLEENFGDCNFIEVLPLEGISNLSFRLPCFYSREIRELASVIANTSVFIGADSGIMHLASAVQVPTVGLFSVSKVEKYKPYGEGSLGIDTGKSCPAECIRMIGQILEKECSTVTGY